MTQQQIIEESNHLATQFAGAYIDVRNAIKIGFQYAANWRIDSVWHDKDERPKKDQLVLFECEEGYTKKGYTVRFGEEHPLLEKIMFRWAYIADLLPQGKEEE